MSPPPKTDKDVPSTQDGGEGSNPAAPLKVWTNHTNTVVAEDWAGVVKVLKNLYLESEELLEPGAWRVIDPWKEVTIYWEVDRHGFPTPHSEMRSIPEEERPYVEWTHKITAPAFAWAQLVGEDTFLCSTEW